MLCVHPIDLDEVSPNAAFTACSLRRVAARRTIAVLRSALIPSMAMPIILLVFGCYALLTLTGIGPRSWQAALCSNGALEISSCRGTPVDPARVSSFVVQVGARRAPS